MSIGRFISQIKIDKTTISQRNGPTPQEVVDLQLPRELRQMDLPDPKEMDQTRIGGLDLWCLLEDLVIDQIGQTDNDCIKQMTARTIIAPGRCATKSVDVIPQKKTHRRRVHSNIVIGPTVRERWQTSGECLKQMTTPTA